MRNSIELYLQLLGISLRSQLQYRISFLLLTFAHFLVTCTEAIGVLALFDRFGNLNDWGLAQVAVFYGTVNIGFALTEAFARGFDIFGTQLVKSGEFDRMLLRPRAPAHLVAGQELQILRLGRLLQGLLVLVYGLLTMDNSVSLEGLWMLLCAVVGTFFFFYGVLILQATWSFWTIESLEIVNAITYGGVEMAQYPMAIYRDEFRRFFTWVIPLGCVAYFPLLPVLGVEDPLGTTRAVQYCTPLAGPLFFFFSLGIWRLGVRYYKSTGS